MNKDLEKIFEDDEEQPKTIEFKEEHENDSSPDNKNLIYFIVFIIIFVSILIILKYSGILDAIFKSF